MDDAAADSWRVLPAADLRLRDGAGLTSRSAINPSSAEADSGCESDDTIAVTPSRRSHHALSPALVRTAISHARNTHNLEMMVAESTRAVKKLNLARR